MYMKTDGDFVKIYTDLALVENNPEIPYATFLYPRLGAYPEPLNLPESPMSSRFDVWCSKVESFQLSSLASCDVAIFPFEFYGITKHPQRDEMLSAFVSRAASLGKQVVLFAYGDEFVERPEYENLNIFQPNLQKSSMNPRHYSMPNFVEDLYARYVKRIPQRSPSRFRFLKKTVLPTISFCGYAESTKVRKDVISCLQSSKYVKTNFVLRDKYFGGAWDHKKGGYDFRKLSRVRGQYVKNLAGSDYALCVRGYGNYSSRIYEALCCGKIPVLIDTDCSLPLDSILDYSQYFLVVGSEELDTLGERVLEFDQSISDERFYEMQRSCRKLWMDYLSPQGFYENFMRYLPRFILGL